MKRMRLNSVLGALSIVAFAGLAQSSSHSTQVVVVGFDQPSNIVTGVNGQGMGYFKRHNKTLYRLAKIKPTAPPNPCNILARVWNKVLPKVPPHRVEKVSARFLRAFAKHNCQAIVVGEDQTFPINLESYEPAEAP
ncbi:MAG TPA: hypothetical protein PKD61_30185 [Polyangiaceae bacterium]|nr:hypothetical protein [Polyangiaceae bacterium]